MLFDLFGVCVNPAIIVPTFWTEGDQTTATSKRGVYDYVTPLVKPLPELEICLSSLEIVRGVLRVIVLVVAPPDIEDAARARVTSICREHPTLNPLIIGKKEAGHIENAISRVMPHVLGETVALRGYGAIKNMGLAVAAVLGHDSVVFIDDDEVVRDPDFLVKAVYGLGSLTRQNLQIVAKTGYYLDAKDRPYPTLTGEWSEQLWSKAKEFRSLVKKALNGNVRITRANHLCGRCCALHAKAYTKIPFDPYITRGEDLDYVLNLRSAGLDVWFDNQWNLRWQPPQKVASAPSRFMQDIYRWYYEAEKLKALNARRDLHTVTTQSLMPYPGPWLSEEVKSRVLRTTLRRLVTGPNRLKYLTILTRGRYEADKYAAANASRYLSFSMMWEKIIGGLWNNVIIRDALLMSGEISPSAPASAPSTPVRDIKDTPHV